MSFSLLFSFGKEELWEGVRLFFEQIFYYLISTTLKSYQTFYSNTYTLYNKARKGTGISLEIALGSNRKNA